VPVLVTNRSLRVGSEGVGQWCGGLGHEIELTCLPTFSGKLTAYVDADHLRSGPRGVAGGGSGAKFEVYHDSRLLSPDCVGRAGLDLTDGTTLRLLVPGGGGYGHSGTAVVSTEEKGA